MTYCDISRWTRILSAAAAMQLAAAMPADAALADAPPAERASRDRQLLLVLDANGTIEMTRVAPLPAAGLIWRAQAELADAADGWQVVIYLVRRDRETPIAWLDGARPISELPRPLGVAFEPGDSLRVRVLPWAGEELPARLRVIVDYEGGEQGASRVPVLPVRPLQSGGPVADRVWEWTMPADGRLLALAGLRPELAGEVVLRDVDSGAVVWRETLQPLQGQAFGVTSDVVRSGVLLRAGRRYQLSIVGSDAAVPLALITPVPPRAGGE